MHKLWKIEVTKIKRLLRASIRNSSRVDQVQEHANTVGLAMVEQSFGAAAGARDITIGVNEVLRGMYLDDDKFCQDLSENGGRNHHLCIL